MVLKKQKKTGGNKIMEWRPMAYRFVSCLIVPYPLPKSEQQKQIKRRILFRILDLDLFQMPSWMVSQYVESQHPIKE